MYANSFIRVTKRPMRVTLNTCTLTDNTFMNNYDVKIRNSSQLSIYHIKVYGILIISYTRPCGINRDYKNPLHHDVVDRYLRRMGDKTIPDEAPPSLESFYPP